MKLFTNWVAITEPEAFHALTEKEQQDTIANELIADDFNPVFVEKYEKAARALDPNYRPLTAEEKTTRQRIHDLAVKNEKRMAAEFMSYSENVDMQGFSRDLTSLFHGLGNTEPEIQRKQEIARILREGTQKERHDLFLETMDRLASFPADEFKSLNIEERMDRLDEFLPTLMVAAVGDALRMEFQKMGVEITPEEQATFDNLHLMLSNLNWELNHQIMMASNPYYAEINSESVSLHIDVRFALHDEIERFAGANSINDYETTVKSFCDTVAYAEEGAMKDRFRDAHPGVAPAQIVLCDKNGKRLGDDHSTLKFRSQLAEGKTVYWMDENSEPKEIMAFADLLGNGEPVVVPPEIEEPHPFLTFIDSIIRFFGGNGLDVVNEYRAKCEERNQQLSEMREAARNAESPSQARFRELAATAHQMAQSVTAAKELERNAVQDTERKRLEIENLEKQLSQLQAEAKKQPEAGRSRDRELADDLNNVAQGEMSRLVIGALAELKGTGERGEVAEPLAEIALAAVTDRMISDYESRPGEKTRHPLTTLLEDDNSYAAMLNTIRTSKEFSAYAGLSGSELVRQLRNPEEKERFTSAMYSVVNNALNSPTIKAVKEAVKVEKPSVERESKEADAGSHWRNPISEAPSVFGSKENQEKAIDYICKRLAAEQTGKSSRLSREDKEWINSHKELMAAVADEAKERYALNVYNELHTRASETITNRKARLDKAVEIARIMAGGKVPTTEEQRKFFADRPGTMRDGLEIVKREILAENPEPLTAKQSETIEMLERIGKSKAEQALAKGEAISSAEDRLSKLPDEIRTQAQTIAAFFTKTGKIENKKLQWANENREAVYDAILCARHEYNLVNYGKPYTMEQENLQVSMLKFKDSPKKFLADAMEKAAAEKKEAAVEPMKKAKEAPVKSV